MIRTILTLLVFGLSAATLSADEVQKEKATQRWPQKLDWGYIESGNDAIRFHITKKPKGGVLRVPRLFNSYEQLYLQSDESKQPLKMKPEIDHWLISLPKSAGDAEVVVMETVGAPRMTGDVGPIGPAKDHSLVLPACLATVHGEKLRFEPQPHKNTVGYWTVKEDWCGWSIDVPKAGMYEVVVWQGCGKGQGGSEVDVIAGGRKFSFTVEDTGHFQNFKERSVGQLQLPSGKQSLEFRPRVKAKNAVMDVRLVVLKPVKAKS